MPGNVRLFIFLCNLCVWRSRAAYDEMLLGALGCSLKLWGALGCSLGLGLGRGLGLALGRGLGLGLAVAL